MSPDEKEIDRHIRELGEHFETVQIFCTRTQDGSEGGGTHHISKGSGNWHARYGQVKMWCIRSEAAEEKLDSQHREGPGE